MISPNEEKKNIVKLLVLIIITGMSFSSVYTLATTEMDTENGEFTNLSELNMDRIYLFEKQYNQQDLREDPLISNIFGYSQQLEKDIPIVRDENGKIDLTIEENDTMETSTLTIDVHSSFGDYHFISIPVKCEIIYGNESIPVDESPTTPAPKSAYSYTKWGIVHNVAFGQYAIWPSEYMSWIENIENYMDDCSQLTGAYTFTRVDPYESQVKSDLQYYNKDYELSYFRDILLYTIYAHGAMLSTTWGMRPADPYDQPILTAAEVEDLWYDSGYYHVSPNDMIVLARSCWGMVNTNMADAFVDYGATAFIGN
ncbi:MAG: hypothetical protein ACTSYI_08395 [Promethearchaeota archaeon]